MNRERQLQLYQNFITNCTTNSKSLKNYVDFKRINECLQQLFPERKDVSILDFDDPIEFEEIVKKITATADFIDYNAKGKNQYSNTLMHYLRFLYAKKMFSNLQIVNDGLKDDYTKEELINVLRNYRKLFDGDNDIANSACDVAFGIKYGKFLSGRGYTKEIANAVSGNVGNVNIKDGYFIKIGVSTFQAIEKEKYGLSFWKHDNYNNSVSSVNKNDESLQQIFYGAPGTGKSHTIKEQTKSDDTVIRTTFHPDSDYSTFVGCYKPTMEEEEVRVVPVVVTSGISLDQNNGTYKEKRITYKFVQQAFTKAYIQAWEKMANYQPIDRIFLVNSVQYEIIGISKDSITVKKLSDSDANEPIKIAKSRLKEIYNASDSDNAVEQRVVSKLEGLDQKSFDDAWTVLEKGFLKPQFLIIEEINRGNCAQIFGDLFQLLDRKYGFSEYPIEADKDLRKELFEEFKNKNLNLDAVKYEIDSIFKENYPNGITEKIKSGELLVLPKNLYIWATMNTSDQSLFPIDSAFKRRWDWKYVPIVQGYDKKTGTLLEWKIKVGDKEYDWWKFLQAINRHIGDTTKSEDKKLGYFFCKAENGIITAETFVGKVLFYLWNDVYKDYDHSPAFFRNESGQLIEYGEYYVQDASHNTIPNIELVKSFIEKVEPKFKETPMEGIKDEE